MLLIGADSTFTVVRVTGENESVDVDSGLCGEDKVDTTVLAVEDADSDDSCSQLSLEPITGLLKGMGRSCALSTRAALVVWLADWLGWKRSKSVCN